MKETQMPPVHAANLVANIGNTAYGVDVIEMVIYESKMIRMLKFIMNTPCISDEKLFGR